MMKPTKRDLGGYHQKDQGTDRFVADKPKRLLV